MKRTLKYALSAVITAALVAPALAQDNFPDVPANHWAFEALARLKKDGILVGYPDGLYRGGRPASRYELAAAVHAAYVNLKNQSDGISSQIDALKAKVDGMGGGVTKADLDNLKAALAATQSQVDGMKAWGDDIASLKKMAGEFSKELQSMGVDVEGLKKGLGDLGDRVTALEKRKLPVDISGGLDLLMLNGYSTSGQFGTTVDGRPTGVGSGDYSGKAVGMSRDFTFLHEGSMTFTGTNDTGPKWHGTVVIGNMLDSDFNNSNPSDGEPWESQSETNAGTQFGAGQEDVYLQDFAVDWDTSIMSLNLGVEAGRVGYKISPLIFQRQNVTAPYFVNDRWSNGLWYFDGANVRLKFSSAKVNVFAGRDNTSEGGSVGGNPIAGLFAGQNGIPFTPGESRPIGQWSGGWLPINQHMGVNVNLPLGANGTLDLAYLWLSSNNVDGGVGPSGGPGQANGVNVYGGTAYFNFGGFNVEGAYSKSDMVMNGHSAVSKQDDAYWINIAKDFGRWGAKVGYRQINPQFGAPGDWGRIGMWWNPTDIKGITADAHLDLSDTTKLYASGQFYTGTGNSVTVGNFTSSGLGTNDKITSIVVGISHKLGTANTVDLGFESVNWNLADRPSVSFTGGKPVERWYNIGFTHKINDKSMFRMLWQISDYDSKNVQGFGTAFNNAATAKGGILSTQLSVKF